MNYGPYRIFFFINEGVMNNCPYLLQQEVDSFSFPFLGVMNDSSYENVTGLGRNRLKPQWECHGFEGFDIPFSSVCARLISAFKKIEQDGFRIVVLA